MSYIPGGNWAICDRCGFKVRAKELLTEWTGVKVCKKCYDPKHPQLSVTSKPDKIVAEVIRTEPTDVFVDENFYINASNDVLAFVRNTACPRIRLTHGTYTRTQYLTAIKTAMEANATLGSGITYTVALSDGKIRITPSSGTIGINASANGSGRAGFIQDIAEAAYITAQLNL